MHFPGMLRVKKSLVKVGCPTYYALTVHDTPLPIQIQQFDMDMKVVSTCAPQWAVDLLVQYLNLHDADDRCHFPYVGSSRPDVSLPLPVAMKAVWMPDYVFRFLNDLMDTESDMFWGKWLTFQNEIQQQVNGGRAGLIAHPAKKEAMMCERLFVILDTLQAVAKAVGCVALCKNIEAMFFYYRDGIMSRLDMIDPVHIARLFGTPCTATKDQLDVMVKTMVADSKRTVSGQLSMAPPLSSHDHFEDETEQDEFGEMDEGGV
jgi:hypothetical protein